MSLVDFRNSLQRMAAGGALSLFLTRAATELNAQLINGFVTQRDPYGAPWKPRKQPTGSWPLLRKTGRELYAFRTKAFARGVKITGVDYANFQQSGTRHMEQRMVAPDPARGLGSIWGGGLERVAEQAMTQLIGGK